MTNPTTKPPPDGTGWLNTLSRCWVTLSEGGGTPDRSALVNSVAESLAIDSGRVAGWLAGLDELARYASADLTKGHAIEEEDAGIGAARRVTAPVFEARLQGCAPNLMIATLRLRACAALTGPRGGTRDGASLGCHAPLGR